MATPFLRATVLTGLGDWLTGRLALRLSRFTSHYSHFQMILQARMLTPDDCIIETGCAGAALLSQVLKNGCPAAAIDHSLDMGSLARQVNQDAVASERLSVRQSGADYLPPSPLRRWPAYLAFFPIRRQLCENSGKS
ncbi:MAG TPA: hypothetical protein VGF67_00105 [Ktedonobacteraceae bacterium]